MLLLLSEPGRALLEYGATASIGKLIKADYTGDGHPVMTLPGFLSNENSTKQLRKFIADLGYEVYPWGLGRNMGKLEYIDLLIARMEEIYKLTGRPISLIGWSLGGIIARQLAKERTDIVRQTITLASPFAGLGEPNNVSWIYTALNYGKKVKEVNQTLLLDLPKAPPVPNTAIFSKSDGIVPWQYCMEPIVTDIHQNIEVRSSHIGMGIHPIVQAIIADRLRQQKHSWERFTPKGILRNKFAIPSY
jgi:pimeloyl-ACP methyl ester carboxylesterase